MMDESSQPTSRKLNIDLKRCTYLFVRHLEDAVPAVKDMLGVGDGVRVTADIELGVLKRYQSLMVRTISP